ncbi:MAG: T9SS type B sorting domain-containing protein [Lacinutrix venerupis]
MKKIVLILTTLLYCAISNAQKEASNWYFGDNAGINFNLDTNTVTAISNGQLATDEGCTSISDSNGNLLFYTDGRTVYNSNHAIMPNGTGLKGDPSSTQSAIIIPKPQDPDTYYIFTVDTPSLDNIDLGFHFYEVNMNLDGGLGGVVANSETQLLSNTSEKLSAVLKDCLTQDVWVITYASNNGSNNNNTFYAYQVTNTGVNTTPVATQIGNSISEARGYLKFSPDGTKLVSANVAQGLFLYDFDKNTGMVSNAQIINTNFTAQDGTLLRSYGVEFSPNNKLLYVSVFNNSTNANSSNNQYGALLQFNLEAQNISDSQVVIDDRQTYRGGLQLGPDGKIYRAMSENYQLGSPFLSVVNSPNQIGTACNYVNNAIALTNNSRQGLPPFITSFFSEDIDIIQNGISTINLGLCTGETYTLMADDIPGATYTWTKDGLPLPESDFDLVVSEEGTYRVEIEVNANSCGLLEGEANVTYYNIPVANPVGNINACDNDNDGITTFDFTSQTSTIIDTQDATVFEVNYFESMEDATDNVNAINGTYTNTSNPQTIFARIDNINNRNCLDITTFEIEVFNTPTIALSNDLQVCDIDTGPTDGQTQIILSNFNTDILGNQDETVYTVTYHESQAHADAGINNLSNNYTNQTPLNETIFIRIENNNNTNCYNTGSLNLVVNPIPEANDSYIYQCDEDGIVNGFTTFNLTEANSALTGDTTNRTTQFYLTLNDAINNTNELNGNAYNNISNPQTVFVRVTNTITSCYNFCELVLETSDTQISNYTAPIVCDEPDSPDGKNTFNLDDFSTDILSGLPSGLEIAYYENANDALLENNQLPSIYENTVPYSQTIYVRVENNNACYGINEVLLTIDTIPDLDDDETVLYCLNEFPNTITLDAGLNDSPSNYSFSWDSGETTETIAVNTAGNFTVTVTNNTTLCSNTRTVTVEPSNIATINDIVVVDGDINNNTITVILEDSEGEYLYALTDDEGNTTLFQSNNTFYNVSPGIYNVLIKDFKNYCGTVESKVSVIGFPPYFTPNGDTFNDTWQVYGVSKMFQAKSEILIFDRFGKLITQINPLEKGWDGTFNGTPLPQSDYWFSVTLQDGRVYKNHFTLRR